MESFEDSTDIEWKPLYTTIYTRESKKHINIVSNKTFLLSKWYIMQNQLKK